jgi:hypothetical protein
MSEKVTLGMNPSDMTPNTQTKKQNSVQLHQIKKTSAQQSKQSTEKGSNLQDRIKYLL